MEAPAPQPLEEEDREQERERDEDRHRDQEPGVVAESRPEGRIGPRDAEVRDCPGAVEPERGAHELVHRVAEDEDDDRDGGRDPHERLEPTEPKQPAVSLDGRERRCRRSLDLRHRARAGVYLYDVDHVLKFAICFRCVSRIRAAIFSVAAAACLASMLPPSKSWDWAKNAFESSSGGMKFSR